MTTYYPIPSICSIQPSSYYASPQPQIDTKKSQPRKRRTKVTTANDTPATEIKIKSCKSDFIAFSEKRDILSLLTLPSINVVSIDPGVENLGLRMEVRYAPHRTFGNNVSTVGMTRTCITGSNVFDNLRSYLRGLHNNFLQTHITIIECQMKCNNDNVIRVSQFCLTYLSVMYPNMIVLEISSKLKTRILGAPLKMSYAQRKKWSVLKARDLFTERGDQKALAILDGVDGKLDEFGDTTTQAEAFFRLLASK